MRRNLDETTSASSKANHRAGERDLLENSRAITLRPSKPRRISVAPQAATANGPRLREGAVERISQVGAGDRGWQPDADGFSSGSMRTGTKLTRSRGDQNARKVVGACHQQLWIDLPVADSVAVRNTCDRGAQRQRL